MRHSNRFKLVVVEMVDVVFGFWFLVFFFLVLNLLTTETDGLVEV